MGGDPTAMAATTADGVDTDVAMGGDDAASIASTSTKRSSGGVQVVRRVVALRTSMGETASERAVARAQEIASAMEQAATAAASATQTGGSTGREAPPGGPTVPGVDAVVTNRDE